MAEANIDRAILAALVGTCGALIALPAGWIWLLMDFSFALFATPDPPDTGDKFFAYVVAPALLAAAGVPSAIFLGAGWRLTLAASVTASSLASAIVIISDYELQALSSALIIAPGLLTLIVSIRTGADAPVIPALIFATGLLAIVGVAILSAELLGLDVLISLSGWVILPAIAGIFQPRTNEPETDG